MRYLITIVFALVAVVTLSPAEEAVGANTYEGYLGMYCTSVHPPRNCGTYQPVVNLARGKVDQFLTDVATYSSAERRTLIEDTIKRMGTVFGLYEDSTIKFLAAYYHVRLSDYMYGPSTTASDDFLSYFFGQLGSQYTYRQPDYRDDDAEIINLWSTSNHTVVDNRNKRITLRDDRYLSVGVKAGYDRYTASKNAGYRMVAVLDSSSSRYDDRTYTATYQTSSNYWSFRANVGNYSPRRITFYLICDDCSSGTRFTAGDRQYRSWYVVDKETYTIRRDSFDRYDRHYDDYYDSYRSYDLGIRSLRYEYEFNRDELEIELKTLVRNYGSYDTELEDLTFRLEVDNRRLDRNDYTYEHVATICDNTNQNYYRYDGFEIEEDDECEIIVRFRIDEDEVYFDNRRVEIEAEIDAERDDNHSNDERSTSFYVRD